MYISIAGIKSKHNYLFALGWEGDQRYLAFLDMFSNFLNASEVL